MQEDNGNDRPKPIEVEKEGIPDTKEEKDHIERPKPIVREYDKKYPKKDNKDD